MISFFRRTSLYILLSPVFFFVLGAASNFSVLIANHDRFPVMINHRRVEQMSKSENIRIGPFILHRDSSVSVDPDGTVMLDDVHCVMTNDTHLNALADVFDLKDGIYSIGDFFLMLGEWLGSFVIFVYVFDVTRKLRHVS